MHHSTPVNPRIKGNEDDTIFEERKSEIEESGSIPDEIDQLRTYNESDYPEVRAHEYTLHQGLASYPEKTDANLYMEL